MILLAEFEYMIYDLYSIFIQFVIEYTRTLINLQSNNLSDILCILYECRVSNKSLLNVLTSTYQINYQLLI